MNTTKIIGILKHDFNGEEKLEKVLPLLVPKIIALQTTEERANLEKESPRKFADGMYKTFPRLRYNLGEENKRSLVDAYSKMYYSSGYELRAARSYAENSGASLRYVDDHRFDKIDDSDEPSEEHIERFNYDLNALINSDENVSVENGEIKGDRLLGEILLDKLYESVNVFYKTSDLHKEIYWQKEKMLEGYLEPEKKALASYLNRKFNPERIQVISENIRKIRRENQLDDIVAIVELGTHNAVADELRDLYPKTTTLFSEYNSYMLSDLTKNYKENEKFKSLIDMIAEVQGIKVEEGGYNELGKALLSNGLDGAIIGGLTLLLGGDKLQGKLARIGKGVLIGGVANTLLEGITDKNLREKILRLLKEKIKD